MKLKIILSSCIVLSLYLPVILINYIVKSRPELAGVDTSILWLVPPFVLFALIFGFVIRDRKSILLIIVTYLPVLTAIVFFIMANGVKEYRNIYNEHIDEYNEYAGVLNDDNLNTSIGLDNKYKINTDINLLTAYPKFCEARKMSKQIILDGVVLDKDYIGVLVSEIGDNWFLYGDGKVVDYNNITESKVDEWVNSDVMRSMGKTYRVSVSTIKLALMGLSFTVISWIFTIVFKSDKKCIEEEEKFKHTTGFNEEYFN